MRSIATCTAIAAMSLVVSGAALSAGTTHATAGALRGAQPTTLGPASTGQPNQTCGSATAPNTPGNAAAAPGSAFNPAGHAGTVYAGEQPQNSRNTASVSQYDVACFHQR
jgi:hypothetical protein